MSRALELLGRTIRRLRKQRGLSQMALAERAGLHLNEISSVERGLRDARFTSLARIARGLDVLHPSATSDRVNLVRYLPLHLWYSTGIASVARGQFASMRTIAEILVPTGSRQREHLLLEITSSDVLRRDFAQALHHRQREFYTPLNDYLFTVVRDAVKDICPTDADYEAIFDRFEYLYCLITIDLQLSRNDKYLSLAGGRYYWQRSGETGRSEIENQIEAELASQKEQWAPVQSGLFGGTIERARAAHERTQEELKSRRRSMH